MTGYVHKRFNYIAVTTQGYIQCLLNVLNIEIKCSIILIESVLFFKLEGIDVLPSQYKLCNEHDLFLHKLLTIYV